MKPLRAACRARLYSEPGRCSRSSGSDIAEVADKLQVIEVLAGSDKSWEDAAQPALTRASQSVHGIKSIYINNFEANISFLLDGLADSPGVRPGPFGPACRSTGLPPFAALQRDEPDVPE